ncbi:MAG: DNA mismatch repair endonuclease MutL [Candidatus Dormibacteraeota bacterium]|nr:DNA mismatch repair endonuclease MutL [Candidatus Dormibacteraeota bacterium]MBV9524418.1 DNA mismatch repair endonuclease MutL [Candidatus Dormibacteraeota bacterium]
MIAAARIRLLPPLVADAIAAGEVVERPASVVKELLENAVDAGAHRVDVDIEGGGLVRIGVVDDGCGIPEEDLTLAVTRHATSKIADVHDLEGIRTLGFRGEALASIAAVADVRVTSRHEASDRAVTLRVRAGEVLETGRAAHDGGTTIEVCDLFAGTPARLRFLRSASAEAAASVRIAAETALANPQLRITVRNDGRRSLAAPGGTLRDAMRAVYGDRADTDLIDVAGSDAHLAVSGAVSAPHAHRATRSGLVIVVNGRRVHSRSLHVAVEEAYRGLLPSGRHPYGVVVVSLDPAKVDVNVHPAKREVRFSDERAVFSAVQRACWEALRGGPVATPPAATWAPPAAGFTPASLTLEDSTDDLARARVDGEAAATLAGLAPLRALGQREGDWIAAASDSAIVLVDPHAAHEKVLYTELLQAWDVNPQAQLLLIPAVVECDAAQLQALADHHADVERLGFLVEEFGPATVRCTAVPAMSAGANAGRLVSDLLDALHEGGVSRQERQHRLAALVACHSAVRFGDRLDAAAQQALLDRLVATPGGMTCPHGRPTVLVLSNETLRHAFRRPPM